MFIRKILRALIVPILHVIYFVFPRAFVCIVFIQFDFYFRFFSRQSIRVWINLNYIVKKSINVDFSIF